MPSSRLICDSEGKAVNEIFSPGNVCWLTEALRLAAGCEGVQACQSLHPACVELTLDGDVIRNKGEALARLLVQVPQRFESLLERANQLISGMRPRPLR